MKSLRRREESRGEARDEEDFVRGALDRAYHDLDAARGMREESRDVVNRARLNHWAEAVRVALGGR